MDSTSALSLAGSAFSTACTAYFWLVKARRERPSLRPFLIDREFYLGNMNGQTRQLGFKVGLVVANYSALPNALVGAKINLPAKDGSCLELASLTFDKLTPLPFNLPSMQTVLLRLQGTLNFAYTEALETGSKTESAYLQHFLAEPWTMRLDLLSLNDRHDEFELALARTAQGRAA